MDQPTTPPADDGDFRTSRRARRQSWYGTKAAVKKVLSWRGPHAVLRAVVPVLPERVHVERLPAPARLGTVTARMAGTEFLMLRPDRCVVAKELYWGAGRRPRPADQQALDVFAALARDARLVLDVGAYTGVFALLGARVAPGARVHAFELVPEVVLAARENVEANGLAEQVEVHHAGVGRDGEVLRVATGKGGSALPDFYSADLRFSDGQEVPVTSLDAFWAGLGEADGGEGTSGGPGAEGGAGAVVVKVDVEGTEGVVLAHAQEFLAATRPDILCEILPGRADVAAVTRALEPHGYRYLRVEGDCLVASERLHADGPHRDWLFTVRGEDELSAVLTPTQ